MALTMTIPLGQSAVLTVDPVTPPFFEVDTQGILLFTQSPPNMMKISPIKAGGPVTIRLPEFGLGQDVQVTIGASSATGTLGTSLTGSFVAYTGNILSVPSVGELPSARPSVPAGTAGGHTPQVSGKPT